MVITTDFKIFADKYHNNQHLPTDIINMIMNINTKNIKTEKEIKKNLCGMMMEMIVLKNCVVMKQI